MPSPILLVALMGRENNPLYVRGFGAAATPVQSSPPSAADLRCHFLAHIALDVFTARLPARSSDSDFGLLFVQDGVAMYGWMTSTGVKIVLGFASGEVVGSEIRSIFRAIHYAYISLVCNPFYTVDDRRQIESRKFDINVRRVVDAWNGTIPSPVPPPATTTPAPALSADAASSVVAPVGASAS
ncbi:Sedlin, N-terminal conserved region-domain-containing protein [Limtongia smithiae]|uniref:Sedlin, N-terminal conserved region-domain-containing protein n=1 Tax=Limtongia smithiae TaxID=1125753 RepID=UPI0034D01CCB